MTSSSISVCSWVWSETPSSTFAAAHRSSASLDMSSSSHAVCFETIVCLLSVGIKLASPFPHGSRSLKLLWNLIHQRVGCRLVHESKVAEEIGN